MSPRNHSWFSLLAFCFASVLASALVFALLLTGATFAFAFGQSAAQAADVPHTQSSSLLTIGGVISDSRCGARHPAGSGKSPAECVRACVRHGASFVLVDGDKVYVLRGKTSTLNRLAGERVQITGKLLQDNSLRVNSISTQPL